MVFLEQEGFLADTRVGEWQLSCGSGHKQLRQRTAGPCTATAGPNNQTNKWPNRQFDRQPNNQTNRQPKRLSCGSRNKQLRQRTAGPHTPNLRPQLDQTTKPIDNLRNQYTTEPIDNLITNLINNLTTKPIDNLTGNLIYDQTTKPIDNQKGKCVQLQQCMLLIAAACFSLHQDTEHQFDQPIFDAFWYKESCHELEVAKRLVHNVGWIFCGRTNAMQWH